MAIRLTATIATSDLLMIGVAAIPPSFPKLETVTVAPVSSWRVIESPPGRSPCGWSLGVRAVGPQCHVAPYPKAPGLI